MDNENSNSDKANNIQIGDKGEKGIPSKYEKLWDKLKEDIGLINILLIFLGSILIIFSPDKGWEFDIPFIDYTLSYRGWIGILCFITVIISKLKHKRHFLKKSSSLPELDQSSLGSNEFSLDKNISGNTEEANTHVIKNNYSVKSLYIHFSRENYFNLPYMSLLLNNCNDFYEAMNLLFSFQYYYNGRIYLSLSVQSFSRFIHSGIKGENDNRWCWWYWDGGVDGFQLIVSLCQ
jgi:hypothetical protein